MNHGSCKLESKSMDFVGGQAIVSSDTSILRESSCSYKKCSEIIKNSYVDIQK